VVLASWDIHMKKPRLKSLVSWANRFNWTYFLFALFSRAEEGMMGGKADKHLPPNAALPHQKSDFAFFWQYALCGSFLRFHGIPPLHQFPSLKRPEAPIMRLVGKIPGEATKGLSVISAHWVSFVVEQCT
jgi:hypothetical protein